MWTNKKGQQYTPGRTLASPGYVMTPDALSILGIKKGN